MNQYFPNDQTYAVSPIMLKKQGMVVHTFNISTQEQKQVNCCEFQYSLVGITGQARLCSETLSQEQEQKHHPNQTVQQNRVRSMDAHVLRHKKLIWFYGLRYQETFKNLLFIELWCKIKDT